MNKAVACFTLVISGLFKSVYAHCWSSFLENVRTTVTNIGQCITIVYVFQNVSDEGIKKTTLPTFLKLGHKRKYIIKTDKVGKNSTMTGMASVHYIKTTRGIALILRICKKENVLDVLWINVDDKQ